MMKLMIFLLISLLLATDVEAASSKKKCTKCERKFDVHADGQRYDAERMLGAQHAFAPSRRGLYLRGLQPHVLALRQLRTLTLHLKPITAPPSRGYTPYQYRPRVMGGFNPSIAPAPAGLCPRCAYVATVRVEALHQCNRRSPFLTGEPEWPRGFFRGTAVAVLDASLSQVLGWTWFIASPEKQITHAEEAAAPNASLHLLQTSSRWKVPRGAADGFPPPWNQPVYDARLFSLSGQLMITYNCMGCDFSVSHLQITARPTPDGGLHELRAWNEHRLVLPMQINGVRTSNDWLKGRNQALFAVPISQTSAGSLAGEDRRSIRATRAAAASDATSAPPLGLMTQPWFGLVGSLGAPRFERVRVMCPKHEGGSFHGTCGHLPPGSKPRHLERVIMSPCRGPSCRNVTLPRPILLRPDTFTLLPSRPGPGGGSGGGGRQRRGVNARRTDAEAQAAAYGDSELRYNHSAQVAALDLGGPRLSTTANLLRVRRPTATASHAATPAAATATASAEHGRCEAYLGIGHVHRGEGRLNRQDRENRKTWRQQRGGGAPRSRGGANATTFMFGYDYTHFFYTLSPVPPYQLLSTSAEFCAGSMQDGNDCESVQFISGLAFGASNLSDAAAGGSGDTGNGVGDAGDIARDGAGDIVLSFGVNDCESRLGRIGLARVWSMLVPLPCTTPPCAACAQV